MNGTHWFHAPNPLTRHLRDWQTVDEISEALRYDPLEGLQISALSLMERHELLIGEKTPLFPTTLSLQAAMTMTAMHRHSLRVRNPAIAEGRRIVSETIEAAKAGVNLLNLPPAPGACLLIVKGITGTAKSVTVKHTLRRLIGQQAIFHKEEPAALFKSATQLSWLFVGMSHDGSRGGLLNGILLAIDRVLGSTHAQDLPKTYKSVERQAGAVIALLHTYYLGILVIDEIQLLNLVDTPHAGLMQLFILSLVNSGIPVVLVGNPFGFAWLSEFSQNLSRGVERPQVFFHPCGAVGKSEDDEWDSLFCGIRSFYVLDHPVDDLPACSAVLKRRSGGIARMALALWCNGQVDVLLDGRSALTADDLKAAYLSEGFADARALCDGFANRDPTLLMRWRDTDIPVDYYASMWGKSLGEGSPDASGGATPPAPPSPPPAPASAKPTRPRSAASKLKAAETRERNKQAARQKLTGSLTPEDMRMEGIKQHALASLDELMRKIEEDKKNASG